ncbi:MAG: CGNR zinc finger domain-containing protein [Dehalococcoidia bacterium]|nr:CGNR zinc finger domain-containing protein [Dehalococcoidia bacterium]
MAAMQPPPAASSNPTVTLDLVREFMNSIDVEEATDSLSSPGALEAWFAERRAQGEPGATGEWLAAQIEGPVTRAQFERALALRNALRALARANHEHEVDREALATVNRIAAELPLTVEVRAPGDARLVAAGDGVDGFLAGVLAAVFLAIQDGTWNRVKICASDTCQWVFYDTSKNRSGTWCSMRVCGNRAKVRKYQQRRKAREQGAGDE